MSITRRLTKNEKRRQKKKSKNDKDEDDEDSPALVKTNGESKSSFVKSEKSSDIRDIEIEYISAELEGVDGIDNKILDQFRDIFNKFTKPEVLLAKGDKLMTEASESNDANFSISNQVTNTNQSMEPQKLSKKKKKLMSRLSVAELKQLVPRPDVVEAHDVTSSDPKLLIYLKASRNTVPVPRHWCHIRKYLQGKRGVEKIPFQLPEFIAETGIAKIRDAVMEQEALRKSRQKARERTRPKMGKIDIDYQVLHDAFFKYQTKPKMSVHGDLYYEGKEFEVQMKERKPGVLSTELFAALGMQEGGPPPWLINMQRYGPPPSYTHMRIPGLNAPLPPGASYGYQLGGWGKPPVDEYNRPLYGDVFGTQVSSEVDPTAGIDKTFRWGQFEFEEEEYDQDEEGEEGDEDEDGEYSASKYDATGLETPSSVDHASLISGLETPDTIDLRKRAGIETPDIHANRELYQVIQERKVSTSANQVFGSDRGYVLPGKSDVQLSIDPDQLETMLNDKDRLKQAHEAQALQSQNDSVLKRPASSMDGAETEDRQKKRKSDSSSAAAKKAKEFKF